MRNRYLIRILCLTLLACMAFSTLLSCSSKGIDEENFKAKKSKEVTDFVLLHISYTDRANEKRAEKIVIQLYPEHAPETVANFKNLVNSGFYDGLKIHRIINGALIQGGDPKSNGTGGSGTNIKGEFSANGVDNKLSHVRGTVSMARATNPNSASSQFFIMTTDYTDYDGSYAAFGQVIYGMNTVDEITKVSVRYNTATGELSYPQNAVTIEEAYFVSVEPQYRVTPTLNQTGSEGSTSNGSSQKPDNADTAPKMSELDMNAIDMTQYEDTAVVTDLVRLNISYTDAQGAAQNGNVVLRLYANVAPETVANFQNLVKSGFYNGLSFHRIYGDGMLIQGGDPKGNGTGNSGTNIKGEFTANGFQNNLSHVKGVISMARATSYNSASCQFFIMNRDYTGFDGNYAAFGYVVSGMDTVSGIAGTETKSNASGEKSAPVNAITIQSATFMSKKT